MSASLMLTRTHLFPLTSSISKSAGKCVEEVQSNKIMWWKTHLDDYIGEDKHGFYNLNLRNMSAKIINGGIPWQDDDIPVWQRKRHRSVCLSLYMSVNPTRTTHKQSCKLSPMRRCDFTGMHAPALQFQARPTLLTLAKYEPGGMASSRKKQPNQTNVVQFS